MELRESALELLAISRVQPFSYNHDKGEFHFGNEIKPIDAIELFGSAHATGEDLTKDAVHEMLQTTPYVYGFRHPIGLPLSSDYFEEGWTGEVARETHDIMADVFLARNDRFEASEKERLLAIRSFDSIRRTQPGDVILHTLGNCACLGPDYTAHLSFQEAGVMEHTFHNVDRLEQKLSLMAGLGHVARRATEWLAGQTDTARQ